MLWQLIKPEGSEGCSLSDPSAQWAQPRYQHRSSTQRRVNVWSRLETAGSRLQAPDCKLQTAGSRLQGSRLQAPDCKLQTAGSRLQGSRLQAPDCRAPACRAPDCTLGWSH
uniref:Uncharacterized protein n=1 Tax=Knipowitschia caucasica TaxID=637954 RepID=A0AAV2JQF2_KNICA